MSRGLSKRVPETLPKNSGLGHNSYDIVGDIAIIRPAGPGKCDEDIGRAIMAFHKDVKTVLAQMSAVGGEFRLRKLKFIAGEKKTKTVHKESGCLFNVDVEKCYFSSRLSYERDRIASKAEKGETVVNMFAGVGCFSIIIAKRAKVDRVFSIDVNACSSRVYAEEHQNKQSLRKGYPRSR